MCPALPAGRLRQPRAYQSGRNQNCLLHGGEERYEDYMYLRMIEREWRRPLMADESLDATGPARPSARAAIVVVFWSHFETRLERLLRQATIGLPDSVRDDLLRRYSSVGCAWIGSTRSSSV